MTLPIDATPGGASAAPSVGSAATFLGETGLESATIALTPAIERVVQVNKEPLTSTAHDATVEISTPAPVECVSALAAPTMDMMPPAVPITTHLTEEPATKQDELRVDPPQPPPRCLLEDFTPFSQSHLWKLMMSFYDRQGVESWAQGIVPHFITSNAFIAKRYCNVLRAYLRDATRPDCPSPLDPNEPLYIVELGTGSGKFSFFFLKALVEAERVLDFPLCKIKYIMTDFTETNFNFWKTHPALAPFVKRGLVDFAIFDATRDAQLALFNSGEVVRACSVKNPLCVVANYLFDTLYHDLFQVDNGVLKEGLVSVGSKRAEEPDPLDPEIIKRLSNQFKYEPVDENTYYGTDRPHHNNILKWYRQFYDTPQSTGATLLVPIGALTALERLSALVCPPSNEEGGGGLVVLSGDKGNNHPEHFRGLSDPHIAIHGSFSVMVNYHAIGVYFASRGGFALHSPQEEASLKVSAFVLPASLETSKSDARVDQLLGEQLDRVCKERSQTFPHLCAAFEDDIVAFGPNDFFVMQKAIKEDAKAPSLKSVLALLKLSGWDPDVFYKFRDVLLDHSPGAPPKLKMDVRYGIPQVWSNYYALDKEKDVAFEIGRLYYGLHDYDRALAFYTLSSQEMGRHHVTSHNMGLCHYSKKQLTLAASCFEEAYGLNPSYQKAATWLQRVQKELAMQVQGSDEQPEVVRRAGSDESLVQQQIELVMSTHEDETPSRPSHSSMAGSAPVSPRSSLSDATPSTSSSPESPPTVDMSGHPADTSGLYSL